MSPPIDQKAYLQKYLSGPSGDKKKKKKKVVKGKGFKIIDDDIDLSKIRPLDGEDLDILGEGEDAPVIAGIIDERPEEIRKLEQFKTSSKWRVITQDDGFQSKIQIEEIKKDIKEVRKENELVFGKMYSDSEDEQKKDSDASPPRKHNRNTDKTSSKTLKPQNSDSDFSPPRKNSKASPKRKDKNYDSDISPPRKNDVQNSKSKNSKDKVKKPSRWSDNNDIVMRRSRSKTPKKKQMNSPKYQRHSDSDQSPTRKNNNDKDVSPPRRKKRRDSDASPPRKNRKEDSDVSPPRKSRKEQNKRGKSSDSDVSPPRRKRESPSRQNSHKTGNKRFDSNRYGESSKQRRKTPDSDQSPPRKKSYAREERSQTDAKSRNSESSTRRDERYKRNSDSPPPTNKKMAKTLEGKMAGLQDAKQLREENDAFRRREEEAFSKMTDDVSGRNAQVVSRKLKRETSEERRKKTEKVEKQKELDEKYKRWGKGLKQVEEREARAQDYLHESSKPLARLKGDRDLESSLKQIERDGDPMLQYIRERKRERGELPPEKPKYKGYFPPNRFNIRPGYRWDGVDRSNGYEKKYFESQSKKRAQEEEAYKWSTEDL